MGKVYPTLKIYVPNTIDYDRLFGKIPNYLNNPTEKEIQKLKEAVYLFLSYLYPSDKYNKKYEGSGYYRPIIIEDFRQITRNLNVKVINLLTDNDYPIIDVNTSYRAKHYPRSYRLRVEFYLKGCQPKEIIIRSVISENYLKKVNPQPLIEDKKDKLFQYLQLAYNKEIITIDESVNEYIITLKNKLLSKIENIRSPHKKEFYENKIGKKINKIISHKTKIEEGKFNVRINKENRRLNSELTYCNKNIRRFIKINNNKNLVEIDIKNSHIYIAATILNKNFFSNKNITFSLFKIKEEYYKNLENNLFNTRFGNKLISNKLNKNKDINLSLYNRSLLLYMSGIIENPDVIEFKSLPFVDGIYEYLDHELFDNSKGREYIKDHIMKFLNMKNYRCGNKVVEMMSKKFPTVNDIIEIFNVNSNGNLSILLQCVESYLLLEVGIKRVLQEIPDLKFATIHDSIIVEEQYGEQIKNILYNAITSETGIPIGLDLKKVENPNDYIDTTVEEMIRKIDKSYSQHRRALTQNRTKTGIL